MSNKKPPNILYVFADQLRHSALGCYGNKTVKTPYVDRFANEGVLFKQAFSSAPICSTYRAQLITGKYPHKNGMICNEYQFFDNQKMMAHYLKEAGYRTVHIGKWHLGTPPFTEEKRHGFDDLYAYHINHRYFEGKYFHNENGPFTMQGYAPDAETNLACHYIQDHQQNHPQKPFCAFLSWGPPHWSVQGTNRDYGHYPGEFDMYPPDEVDIPCNVPKSLEKKTRQELSDYYAMTTSLDRFFGTIIEFLKQSGLEENTIVCFTSDHGDHLGAHGYGKPQDHDLPSHLRASKGTPYEESIHVPFILRFPSKISGNTSTDFLFSSVDVMPTLLGLCGLNVSQDVQGKDFSRYLCGEDANCEDSVYLQILGTGWPSRAQWVGLWRGIRTQRYTYARWKDMGEKRLLFDLKNDPYQLRNLVSETSSKIIVDEMEQRLQEWIKRTEDPFDVGRRLPVTHMLDLKQSFVLPRYYELAPQEYVKSIEKYRPNFEAEG